MKKITIIIVLAFNSLHAQIVQPVQTPSGTTVESTVGEFKPKAKDVTLEFNLSPSNTNFVSINYLKGRYFLKDNIAMRAGLGLGLKASKDSRTFDFALLPGIEKHFKGAEKLSPYIGCELILALKSSSTSDGLTGVTDEKGSNRGFFKFGLNAILGCDYYFYKRIYAGLEAGYGLSLVSASNVLYKNVLVEKGGSEFELGPNFNSAIRIGFAF
jgi:hypothetical protein